MINVFTAFSGYDSQCLGLQRLKEYSNGQFDFDLVGWSEIDKNAIKAHDALFPEYSGRNFGDITKIDWANVPDFDLFFYSSPCQDFSNAGLQRGGEENSGTRSSLLWSCYEAIKVKRPKYLILENVSALVQKKFFGVFKKWGNRLSELGYKNFWQLLNAKDFGVPQNRERVFLVSILGEGNFYFPQPRKLDKILFDLLELDCDKSYYLNEKQLELYKKHNQKQIERGTKRSGGFFWKISGEIARAVTTKDNRSNSNFVDVKQVGNIIQGGNFDNPQRGRVYDPDGLSPCLSTCGEGNLEPKIILRNATADGLAPTLRARDEKSGVRNMSRTDGFGCLSISSDLGIRKLTPRECYRLMDVPEDKIDILLNSDIAKGKHYQLSGNSIVVSVLFEIFKNLLWETKPKNGYQLTLF